MHLAPSFGVLELVLSFAGAGLHLLLILLLLRKRPWDREDSVLLGALAVGVLWHGLDSARLYGMAVVAEPAPNLFGSVAVLVCQMLAVTFVLHLMLLLSEVRSIWTFALYALPLAVIATDRGAALWTGAALGGSAILSVRLGGRESGVPRAFYWCLAASLVMACLGAATESHALLDFTSLLPPACLLYFVYRGNALGLILERRLVFVLTMAVISVVYLLIVRFLFGEYLSLEYGAFGALVEFSLICAAAVVWVPLYHGITRFLSRRGQAYLEMAKRIIDAADGLLEAGNRVEFLCQQIAVQFKFPRVLLAIFKPCRIESSYGPKASIDTEACLSLEEYARQSREMVIHARRIRDSARRGLLRQAVFTYVFPLWFKEQLIGMLLIDTSPRVYLDEQEPILTNLAREIAHSIETCRLIEEKIGLEKALMHQEHLASLGKVAATIAHEIKNPLSSIKALAQLMKEDPAVEETYSRDLSFIISEADRLASSVQQLLAFSRPAASPRPDVSLYDLLSATASALERENATSGIVIRKSLDERLRDRLVDRQSFQQILWNLMLNAVQASSVRDAVTLTARLENETQGILIEVMDEGPGIPPEIRDQVFAPFFTTKKQGTGLGLAIVKKNVANLGGTIDVVSPAANGRGALFRVAVPLTQSMEATA